MQIRKGVRKHGTKNIGEGSLRRTTLPQDSPRTQEGIKEVGEEKRNKVLKMRKTPYQKHRCEKYRIEGLSADGRTTVFRSNLREAKDIEKDFSGNRFWGFHTVRIKKNRC